MKTKSILLLLLTLLLVACTALSPTVTPQSVATVPNASLGNVYIDAANLLMLESFPIQLRLALAGNLPTPCHQLGYEIAAVNAEHQIHVRVYSTADPALSCVQVLQPFDETISIPLAGLQEGSYEVWLNGELLGEFSYPG